MTEHATPHSRMWRIICKPNHLRKGGKHSLPTQASPHPINAFITGLLACAEAIAFRLQLPWEEARAATAARTHSHTPSYCPHMPHPARRQPLYLPERSQGMYHAGMPFPPGKQHSCSALLPPQPARRSRCWPRCRTPALHPNRLMMFHPQRATAAAGPYNRPTFERRRSPVRPPASFSPALGTPVRRDASTFWHLDEVWIGPGQDC